MLTRNAGSSVAGFLPILALRTGGNAIAFRLRLRFSCLCSVLDLPRQLFTLALGSRRARPMSWITKHPLCLFP